MVLASEVLATVEDDEVELAAEAAVLVVVAWVVVASCCEIDTLYQIHTYHMSEQEYICE